MRKWQKVLLEATVGKINWSEYTDPMVVGGVELMRGINGLGFEAYVVGGAVRDISMGDKDVHDIDIATNMPIEEIKKHFKTIEYGGGEKHGTVIVHYKSNDYELTQFRTESGYSDKRRPDKVEFVQSFEEDTKRRDFTINSMGIDAQGNVIDYHGGAKDIENKVLRTVGDPKERFDEDVLRILRAIRFAARFGFTIDEKTLDAITELGHTVPTTSIERIRDELLKTIGYGANKFAHALKLMQQTDLWNVIIPELPLSDELIKQVSSTKTKDTSIVFAILMQGLNVTQIDDLGTRLRFTTDEIKEISYIVSNLNTYSNIDKADVQDSLRMTRNKNFSKLREVYIAIHGSDITDADQKIGKISAYSSILDRDKTINMMIKGNDIKNKQFSEMINKVKKWLFDEFAKGNEPSDEEILKFIQENKNG